MTNLECVLSMVLWVIIGVFTAYKRDWYSKYVDDDGVLTVMIQLCSIAFGPYRSYSLLLRFYFFVNGITLKL